MTRKHGLLAGVLLLVWMAAGCAHPISGSLREQVDKDMNFGRLLAAPEQFSGEKVVLGGIIVQTRNYDGWSEVEVIQVPLSRWGRPDDRDASMGRVLFRYEGFLEPEIYKKDREITVGGTISGTKTGTIDKAVYDYPVVKVEEFRLWDKIDYGYYGYPYPYYGYGYWGPYYSPAYFRRGPFFW